MLNNPLIKAGAVHLFNEELGQFCIQLCLNMRNKWE